uniref:Exopolygalacturonase (ExoPG) (Poly(1,4-alpha-D-galacturonide)galacturonohydrolase)) n=1 Tax=Ganoderma boninense TaxID=34458 RepID=A0A5K1JXV1_9APHY|nr:Exopolygalacturonase (ExoPG) (EC (Galacturan 1,4-alpha-galacturonidase) (Poly(1,4-alpha-D-galacturonide)galacturonohydrolase) [Ganoderma boninense]
MHQLLRRYETYTFSFYALALLVPPALLVALPSQVHTGPAPTFGAFLQCLALYVATLGASIAAYRLSPFHPLARYPGPLPGKLSGFWMAYVSTGGRQQHYLKALHDRYGDVLRIGPNTVVIRKPSTANTLIGGAGLPKGPQQLGRFLSDRNLAMIALQDTELHIQRRRAWNRGLSPAALKGYEDQIARRAGQLVAKIEEHKGEVLLDHWFGYFTYDFMSDMAFGGGTGDMLSGKGDTSFWTGLERSARNATFFGHVPWFGVMLGRVPFLMSGSKDFLGKCKDSAARRLQRGSVTRDLFHYLNHEDVQDAKRPRPPFQQLVSDGILAMVAGSDTVASTLTSLFACLFAHPEVYEKLQEEVDKYYPPGEALHTKHHRDMHYLTGVINEALRIFPAVPNCTQRQVPKTGDGITVDGVRAQLLARARRLPARALAAAVGRARAVPRARVLHNEAAFMPFSIGPMNCVGKALAMQEMRTVVCAVLQRVRLRPVDGWRLEDYDRGFKDYFVTVRGELPALVEVRAGRA